MGYLNLSPGQQDAFSRTLAQSFSDKRLVGLPVGFQAFYDSGYTYWSDSTLSVDITIQKAAGKGFASFVPRGGDGLKVGDNLSRVTSDKWTQESKVFPLIEETTQIEANRLLYRLPDETPYQALSKQRRMRELALEKHVVNIERIITTYEILASYAFLNGKHPTKMNGAAFDYVNDVFDFHRRADHQFTPAVRWDQANATIMADIDAQCAKIKQHAHLTPKFMGIGMTAFKGMISNAAFYAAAEKKQVLENTKGYNLRYGEARPEMPAEFQKYVNAGWTYVAKLNTDEGNELYLFTYNEGYFETNDVYTPFWDQKKAFIMGTGLRFDRYFGPDDKLPQTADQVTLYQQLFGVAPVAPTPPRIEGPAAVFNPAWCYVDAYRDGNNKSVKIRTQTAPIYVPVHTDGIVTINAIA
jgi:hypothetical protein